VTGKPVAAAYGLALRATPCASFHSLHPPLTRPPKGACPFATWQGGRTGGLRPSYLPPSPIALGHSKGIK